MQGGTNMRNTKNVMKASAVGIVILFLFSGFLPCLAYTSQDTITPTLINIDKITVSATAEITCYVIGIQGTQSIKKTQLSTAEAEWVINTLQLLKHEVVRNAQSEKAKGLQKELLMFSDAHHLLPAGVSITSLQEQLNTASSYSFKHLLKTPVIQGKASEWFCNFISVGEGSTLPIIILPRFIPFLVTPIPRAFIWWSTPSGYTSVGGLISNTGFIAAGGQKGIALGFWGVGFSIFLPPIHSYGLFGYAVYSRVTAEQFEFWPPNNPPEVTQTDPVDGQQMVSMSTSELRFSILDADGDLMTYSVTTSPDIGSGSGGLKPDGTYSIPISGLDSNTQYTWHIEVTDGMDTVEKTLTFTTEPVAPVVSNPFPEDGERQVPSDLAALRFSIMDFQGDAMDYTVETSPFIGSVHVVGVHDGTYTVPVNGVQQDAAYRWFINVTDGAHMVRKIYGFETGFPAQFNPFEYGWQYQKLVTIDHTNVAGDVENFPVLLSIVDTDLSQKARTHGEDILFMSSNGVSTRFNYEIESYDHDTGALIAWVNVSHLSSSQDALFYMYYGNPSCLAQQYPEKTWDSHYLMVTHLNDATGGAVDSTHQHDSSAPSPPEYQMTGKIGYAMNFIRADSQYLLIHNSDDLDGLSAITVEAWIKMESEGHQGIVCKSDGGWYNQEVWQLTYFSGDAMVFRLAHNAPGNQEVDAKATIAETGSYIGVWAHVVGTWVNGQQANLYRDGIARTPSPNTFSGMLDKTCDARIGDRSGLSQYFNGLIDEVHISNIKRSSSWILTEYHNQNNPSTFLSVGPEVPGL
jgi:hypothetical protein